jgi:hypothetical protein
MNSPSAPRFTWKTKKDTRVLYSTSKKQLGAVCHDRASFYLIAYVGRRDLYIGSYPTENRARAALIRWWLRIVRTEL